MAEIQRNEQTQNQIAEVSPQYVDVRNSTANIAVAELTFLSASSYIWIRNTDAAKIIYVYFIKDKAGTYNTAKITLPPLASYGISLRTLTIKLAASADGATYELAATLEN